MYEDLEDGLSIDEILEANSDLEYVINLSYKLKIGLGEILELLEEGFSISEVEEEMESDMEDAIL